MRGQTASAIRTITEGAARKKSKEISAVRTALRDESPAKADAQQSSVLSGQVKLKAYKNLVETPVVHPQQNKAVPNDLVMLPNHD